MLKLNYQVKFLIVFPSSSGKDIFVSPFSLLTPVIFLLALLWLWLPVLIFQIITTYFVFASHPENAQRRLALSALLGVRNNSLLSLTLGVLQSAEPIVGFLQTFIDWLKQIFVN